jgi:hypothetical protein
MGSLFSSPKIPPVPTPPPAAAAPTLANPEVAAAGDRGRAKAAAALEGGTLATTPQGLKEPTNTAKSTLLGSAAK